MATINDIYIFVKTEEFDRDTDITQHPVEEGLPTTSTIRSKPKTVSLTGMIVKYGSLSADDIIDKIENLRKKGSLIKYKGRKTVGNYLIKSFRTVDENTNAGGSNFDMTLLEVRITKSAYTPSKGASSSSGSNAVKAPVLKVGSIVVFKGGSVYVSSDATRPAATRGRSTCKITIINNRNWSLHDYHLISQDGGKVYGWVDVKNIEGTGTTGTAAKTNGGTQQVSKK